MMLIVDRFEGDLAVLEMPDKTLVTVPRVLLKGARECDVVLITVEHGQTLALKQKVQSLMDKLFID